MVNARILIVDDEEAIVQMVERVLKKEGFKKVVSAVNASDALEIVQTRNVDLILLDVMMPGQSGFEVCPLIRQHTKAPIFFLTAKTSDLDKLSGFAYGADDYITKPFNPLELVARIKAHLKRTYSKTEEMIHKGMEEANYSYEHFTLKPDSAELIVNGEAVGCSAQLLQLLQYFCDHPNLVLSKDQLYERVWGSPSYGDNNTVMVHVRKLREKIEINASDPKYIVTVRGLGYKFIPNRKQK
jgi:two-component system OmpR family response regulator